MALGALAVGCGGGDDSNTNAAATASDEPVTLNVGLFGTFGYKEAGLYDEYMADHPNVKIVETSVEQEGEYYQALQTHLAASSGLADIQGIEVGRIAEVTSLQPDKWVDLNTLGAGDVEDTFFPWKWGAATTADGKTLGLGTDTGPLAICYRHDLLEAAGLPDRPRRRSRASGTTWDELPRLRRRVPEERSEGRLVHGHAPAASTTPIIGQSEEQYYDEDGQHDLRHEPGREGRVGHRRAGRGKTASAPSSSSSTPSGTRAS